MQAISSTHYKFHPHFSNFATKGVENVNNSGHRLLTASQLTLNLKTSGHNFIYLKYNWSRLNRNLYCTHIYY